MVVMPMRQQNRLDGSVLGAQHSLQVLDVGRLVGIAGVQQDAPMEPSTRLLLKTTHYC